MNPAILIADAVVAAINDPVRNWELDVVATRAYRPNWNLENLPNHVKVTVIPVGETSDRVTRRGVDDVDFQVKVLVQRKLTIEPSENPEDQELAVTEACDPLMNFVTVLGELLSLTVPNMAEGRYISDSVIPFDQKELEQNMLFATMRSVTYRVFE